MTSERQTGAVQGCTLDTVDTISGFSHAKTMLSMVSRVSTPKRERLFGAGQTVRPSGFKTSILTLDTLDTLDRRKKTKGYRRHPVQGVQGIGPFPSSTLDTPPTPALTP